MRIAVMTLGTRGDVHPVAALGAELSRRGHHVRLGVSVNLADVPVRLGLDAVGIGWDTQRVIGSAAGQDWVRSGDPAAFTRGLREIAREHDERLDTEVLEVCAGADAVVAGVLLESRAHAVAEAAGVPLVVQDCFPRRPNTVVPHPLVSTRELGSRAAVLGTYREFGRLADDGERAAVQRFRARLGLPPRPVPGPRPLELQTYSGLLVPGLTFDRHRPMVGDLRMAPEDVAALGGSAPDAGLDAWLDAGDPPALVAFGSTVAAAPAALVATTSRVCAGLGLRALVVTGWGLGGAAAGPGVLVRSYVDYDTVLPRCALAVHHGSASVTAAAVRAGIPAMVCSSFFDQPFWGERVRRLGVGTHARFADLTGDVLRAGLGPLVTAPVRERAAELGRRLRAEPDGTLTAADRIEEHLGAARAG